MLLILSLLDHKSHYHYNQLYECWSSPGFMRSELPLERFSLVVD